MAVLRVTRGLVEIYIWNILSAQEDMPVNFHFSTKLTFYLHKYLVQP